MTVKIVNWEEKCDMFHANEVDQITLTDIGKEYGVSRKTVRRCIDQVAGYLEGLCVGDKLQTVERRVATITKIETPVQDSMPVKVRYDDDQDIEWLHLGNIDTEVEVELCSDDEEDLVVEVESERLPETDSGIFVKINKKTCKYTFSDDMDFNTVFKAEVNDFNQTGTKGDYTITAEDLLSAGGEYFLNGVYGFYKKELEFLDEMVEPENAKYFVTAPQDSITILRIDQDTGEVNQRQTNKHREDFQQLRERIRESQSQEVLRDIYMELDTKKMLESYSVGRIKVDPVGETVVFIKPDGSERSVPQDLSMDIVETVKRHGKSDGEKLVKFLDKLMDNQSFKAIEGLYRFMKHNCIGINDDGSIQAWKGVRNDFYSSRAGSLKTSDTITVNEAGNVYNGDFGKEIRVDRSEVDDDPDETCSHGLHVGNKSYASGWSQKLISVRVEPQDVVAVPKDYNGAKMRCSAYVPLEIVSK